MQRLKNIVECCGIDLKKGCCGKFVEMESGLCVVDVLEGWMMRRVEKSTESIVEGVEERFWDCCLMRGYWMGG